jgi:hypothetical protein
MVWQSDRRIYTTHDRSRIVEESEPGGKRLLAGAGGKVSDEDCRRYGLGPYEGMAPVEPETPEQELARLQAERDKLDRKIEEEEEEEEEAEAEAEETEETEETAEAEETEETETDPS